MRKYLKEREKQKRLEITRGGNINDIGAKSKSKLLYNGRFNLEKFVMALSPLRLTTRDPFLQMCLCGNSPYITSSLTRRWV
jgi:hypothetical protein